MSNSLVLFSKGAQLLAEANTIQKTKELKDIALTAADWAKRRGMGEEAIRYAQSYALQAERKMGELLIAADLRASHASNVLKHSRINHGKKQPSLKIQADIPTLKDLGLTNTTSFRAQALAKVPEEKFEEVLAGKKTRAEAIRDLKRTEIVERLENISAQEAKELQGVYDVIVLDPPWAMEKIERDCRPNQMEFDYPTMNESQLEALKIPAADDCHVFCWTTHKFLPMAFRLIEKWGFKYCCCMVWHKPGGFQVVGLPQYNCEFCLYARKGSPKFIDLKAFNVCNFWPRGKHSEKPEQFYELLRRVTAGRRADMFNRRKIEGFESWGNEAK